MSIINPQLHSILGSKRQCTSMSAFLTLKMIQVPPADGRYYVKQEEGSFVEVESVVEYRLAQNSLIFEEIQLQHADISENKIMISPGICDLSKSNIIMNNIQTDIFMFLMLGSRRC